LTVELATEEVNHVSILFGMYGISRCRVVSTVGLAALAVKASRKKNGAEEIVPNLNNKEKLRWQQAERETKETRISQ
jgi:hypothetical protein